MAVPALRTEPHPPQPAYRESVKVALASLIGTSIEWYDFFLYGTAAALVFNKLLFPTFDPLVGTIAAFATFALSAPAPSSPTISANMLSPCTSCPSRAGA